MSFRAEILFVEFVTHDTKRFILTKPEGLRWQPGQGIELIIDLPEWRDQEGRPFTPTSGDDDLVLEFTIKQYPEHQGVTKKLHSLHPGDAVLLSEPFGAIQYKGPGTFIAAGAGITPFIAIFRELAAQGKLNGCHLLYSNKTVADIICEKELRFYFQERCVLTCTREKSPGGENRRIDQAFLKDKIRNFDQYFYVCGPEEFVKNINGILQGLGAERLVYEDFEE
jgi:ferredoxin-NADP reductase